jgi:hypothetical protein
MREKVKITGTQYKNSKAGNRMIALTLETPSGERIYHYITFIPDKPDITNRMLDNFFKGFKIKSGNFEFSEWLGQEAEAELADEEWNGRTYKKVKFFVTPFVPSAPVQKVLDHIKPQVQEEQQPQPKPQEKPTPVKYLDDTDWNPEDEFQ